MKKQLLKETEIRKMMKFANIGALSNGFVERLNEQAEMEEPEEEAPAGEELPPEGGDPGEEAGLEAGGPEDMEAGPEAEGGDEILDKVADAMEAFKAALELAGPEGQKAAEMLQVEKEGEPGGEEPDELAMGGDDLDMGGDELGVGGEEEAIAEIVDEDVYEEDMINEVARRVARRLRARS